MLFAGVRGRLDGLDVGAVLDYLDLADVAFWTAKVVHVCLLRRDLPNEAAAWMAAVGALDAAASGALGKMRMDPRGSELLGLMCDVGERATRGGDRGGRRAEQKAAEDPRERHARDVPTRCRRRRRPHAPPLGAWRAPRAWTGRRSAVRSERAHAVLHVNGTLNLHYSRVTEVGTTPLASTLHPWGTYT